MAAEHIAKELGAAMRSGRRWWRCRCPVHQSTGPTLALRDGDHGLIVKCHANCSRAEILAELRRLGLLDGTPAADVPRRCVTAQPKHVEGKGDDRWRHAWQRAKPIAGTLAEAYLGNRGLHFEDPAGAMLRFADRHFRRNAKLEQHPALLALLSDVFTGQACGVINIYLAADGRDRLRDPKAKTSWGRVAGAAAMLSAFDVPTYGLCIAEGVETGIAILMGGVGPTWSMGGCGNLAKFPLLAGIEALTIAADTGAPGQNAAAECAARWRAAGREVAIVTPLHDDWASARRAQHG